MFDPDEQKDDDLDIDEEEFEAYCVRCKQKVVMEQPTPVWTRRGTPGTRGTCEICGTTIFRMGRTDAHRGLIRPEMTRLMGEVKPARKRSQARFGAYINYAPDDETFAAKLAEDLSQVGVPTWLDPDPGSNNIRWASGVHPALEECSHMVVVLSKASLDSELVAKGWAFFRAERKPVLVAQIEPCEVPDDLRSRPRYDFTGDYKQVFREMVQVLSA